MRILSTCIAAVGISTLLAAEVRSDFLVYKVPLTGLPGRAFSGGDDDDGDRRPMRRGRGPNAGFPAGRGGLPGGIPGAPPTELRMVLTGRITVNGRTVSYSHPSVKDTLYFSLDDVEFIKAPTLQQEYNKRASAAAKDADGMMKAALWALKKGMLREFYIGVDKVLAIDPKHEGAARIKELKKRIDQPSADNPALEQELRSVVKKSDMQVVTSNHFILLHDTQAKAAPGKRKNRSQERLDLLEEVYESFLMLFHAQDVELDIPRDRMKVVLLREISDYEEVATRLNPALSSPGGFWDPNRNVSVFSDRATDSTYDALEKIQDDNKKKADDAKRARANPQLVRFAKTVDLLLEVSRENADVTVVSHEATHQIAGNTGLLPRQVEIPRWVREGLATYFEAPSDATWAGIGAVSNQRLETYRALGGDGAFVTIDLIVADQIFELARLTGGMMPGTGQAWALTHFLLENYPKELIAFYRMLGNMPPDVSLNPSLLTDVFNQVFGSDHKALDQEWRQYMKSLKTDQERLEEGGKRGA